jgi:transposase InsO family protein
MRLVTEAGYPAAAACRALGLPRSGFYARAAPGGDPGPRAALLRLAGEWPTYGYRRLTALLRREGHAVNGKRVRRLMHELGLAAAPPARRVRTTDSAHGLPRYPNRVAGLEVVRPEQVWVADITYIRLRAEFVYLAVVMDVFTRGIRGWHLGRSLEGTLTVTALRRALQGRRPEVHHSDQGIQYATAAYVELLEAAGAAISMAAAGKPEENWFAERLMRTIKEEEVALTEYRDLADARSRLGRFLEDVYNTRRIHSALGYLTPAEFEQQWQESPRPGQPPLRAARQ